MLKKLLFFVFLLVPLTMAAEDNDTVKFKLFDAVTFYDGYLYSKNPDSLVNDGVLRHSTSLYAVPLNDSILNNIGDSVWLKRLRSGLLRQLRPHRQHQPRICSQGQHNVHCRQRQPH